MSFFQPISQCSHSFLPYHIFWWALGNQLSRTRMFASYAIAICRVLLMQGGMRTTWRRTSFTGDIILVSHLPLPEKAAFFRRYKRRKKKQEKKFANKEKELKFVREKSSKRNKKNSIWTGLSELSRANTASIPCFMGYAGRKLLSNVIFFRFFNFTTWIAFSAWKTKNPLG